MYNKKKYRQKNVVKRQIKKANKKNLKMVNPANSVGGTTSLLGGTGQPNESLLGSIGNIFGDSLGSWMDSRIGNALEHVKVDVAVPIDNVKVDVGIPKAIYYVGGGILVIILLKVFKVIKF